MGIIFSFRKTHLKNQMAKDDKIVLYARKIISNPLLRRKQVQVEIIHPDQGGVSKTEIKEKLAGMFKQRQGAQPECISVFGLKTKFGGGRSTGFALIYDNADARAKYDQKLLLKREGMTEKPKYTRKMKKEMKGRTKKVRGTAKAKAASSSGKKK